VQPDPGTLESLRSLIAPLVSPLATTGRILHPDPARGSRQPLICLAGSHDLQRTTAALDDAAGRLSRLFLDQLLINTGFGILIGVGLWIIGIPSAVLWSILAAVLRFVPCIGSIIAAAFPLVLAVAVDPSWTMLAWTAVLFFRHRAGHRPGRRADGLRPQHRPVAGRRRRVRDVPDCAVGTDRPRLGHPADGLSRGPRASRRKAGLPGRDVRRPAGVFPARNILSTHAGGRPDRSRGKGRRVPEGAVAFLLLRRGRYAQAAARPGRSRPGCPRCGRLAKIRDAVSEFAEHLSDPVENISRHETTDPEAAAALDVLPARAELRMVTRDELSQPWQGAHAVLCIAGRTPLDEAAGVMFMDLVRAHGLQGRIEGADALSTANIFRLETAGVALVCLSYLDTGSAAHTRFTVRCIRRKLPNATIMLGLWNSDLADATLEQLRENLKADVACRSLHDAVDACIKAAQPHNSGSNVQIASAVAS
jgi:hypothetical protein